MARCSSPVSTKGAAQGEVADYYAGQRAAWGFLPNYAARVLDPARRRSGVERPQRRRPGRHGPAALRDRHHRGGPGATVDLLHGGALGVPARRLRRRAGRGGDRRAPRRRGALGAGPRRLRVRRQGRHRRRRRRPGRTSTPCATPGSPTPTSPTWSSPRPPAASSPRCSTGWAPSSTSRPRRPSPPRCWSRWSSADPVRASAQGAAGQLDEPVREVAPVQREGRDAARRRRERPPDRRTPARCRRSRRPRHRIVHSPAARTLRTQSVPRPHGSAMRKVVSVGITAIGHDVRLPAPAPPVVQRRPQRHEPAPGQEQGDLVELLRGCGWTCHRPIVLPPGPAREVRAARLPGGRHPGRRRAKPRLGGMALGTSGSDLHRRHPARRPARPPPDPARAAGRAAAGRVRRRGRAGCRAPHRGRRA